MKVWHIELIVTIIIIIAIAIMILFPVHTGF